MVESVTIKSRKNPGLAKHCSGLPIKQSEPVGSAIKQCIKQETNGRIGMILWDACHFFVNKYLK